VQDETEAYLSGVEEMIKALIRNAAEETRHHKQEVRKEASDFWESDSLDTWVKVLSIIKNVNLDPASVRWNAKRTIRNNYPIRPTERK
jgi:hypothetical protein